MTWKPLALITAIVLAHWLVFASLGVVGFAPTPTPHPAPHATYTPNPALARHYVSPTITPTPTITPGPTSVFGGGPEKF
jgi:hypothetical protein